MRVAGWSGPNNRPELPREYHVAAPEEAFLEYLEHGPAGIPETFRRQAAPDVPRPVRLVGVVAIARETWIAAAICGSLDQALPENKIAWSTGLITKAGNGYRVGEGHTSFHRAEDVRQDLERYQGSPIVHSHGGQSVIAGLVARKAQEIAINSERSGTIHVVPDGGLFLTLLGPGTERQFFPLYMDFFGAGRTTLGSLELPSFWSDHEKPRRPTSGRLIARAVIVWPREGCDAVACRE